MALDYDSWVSQLANLTVISSGNANFQTFLPGCRDYAEQRIYRELDLLGTSVTDASTSLSSGDRNFSLPTSIGTFLVVDNFNVITPVTATSTNGTRHPLTFVTPEFIDFLYPSNSNATGRPEYVAMLNSSSVIVGPAPDRGYNVEVRGTQRPTPLSSANTTTILTTMLPDLFMAASMIFASAYMRDFSAQGDNPQMATGWEKIYNDLKQSADVEELRKVYQSQGWTSQNPTQITTPQRV